MANTILRDAAIISVIAVGTVLAFQHRDKIYSIAGIEHPAPVIQDVIAPEPEMPRVQLNQGSVVSIPKSQRDGQFWTDATVNSGYVRFLIDTGASAIALTKEDAQRAGLRLNELNYNVPIRTAGGRNMAARVTLKTVSVGSITLRNIEALVVPEGLETSLLGMTYLGQLQKVEATPSALLLRL
ncbi:TIGR02281 family clan AA aspartic protease [Hellea balneolensis]|uniref:TIGR02281 family clan AA aspartic protease n=1 Tax=Hellea balneolensis TaxID=287478 RepID=UPI00138ACD9D|nr:TIGR02281 family clan AA aspartic protease [Hellea balneolensis]